MPDLDDYVAQLEHAPHCRALLLAWRDWRNGQIVPQMTDIRAEDLGPSINSVSVLEVQGPDRVFYRLFASLHASVIGRDLKDANLIELTPPAERETRALRLLALVAQPCGGMPATTLTRPSGVEIPIQALVLPVRPSDEADSPRLYMAIDLLSDAQHGDDTSVASIPLVQKVGPIDLGRGIPTM